MIQSVHSASLLMPQQHGVIYFYLQVSYTPLCLRHENKGHLIEYILFWWDRKLHRDTHRETKKKQEAKIELTKDKNQSNCPYPKSNKAALTNACQTLGATLDLIVDGHDVHWHTQALR